MITPSVNKEIRALHDSIYSIMAGKIASDGYRVALLGGAITLNNGNSTLAPNPVGGANMHGWSVLGIYTWMQSILGHPFNTLINVSIASATSATILSNMASALAVGPDYVIGHDWWVNDITSGVSLATSQSTIDSIIKQCNAAGATVILTDYLPVAAYTTTAMVVQHYAMMDWLRSRKDRGFIFVPISDAVVDMATGKPLAWATSDGTLPSAKGAYALGSAFANGIAQLMRGTDARHPTGVSAYAGGTAMGNPKELVVNPMITGAPGPGLASGYSASGTGSPSSSIVVANDLNLQWQRITFGANGYINIIPTLQTGAGKVYTGPAGTLTLVAGTTKTRFQFEFRIPTASAAGKWVSVEGRQYYTGAPDNAYALQENNSAGQDTGFVPDDNMIHLARSPEYVMPAAATAINGLVSLYGQAGAVIDIRRVSLAVTN